jgi:hypothetical protein
VVDFVESRRFAFFAKPRRSAEPRRLFVLAETRRLSESCNWLESLDVRNADEEEHQDNAAHDESYPNISTI